MKRIYIAPQAEIVVTAPVVLQSTSLTVNSEPEEQVEDSNDILTRDGLEWNDIIQLPF